MSDHSQKTVNVNAPHRLDAAFRWAVRTLNAQELEEARYTMIVDRLEDATSKLMQALAALEPLVTYPNNESDELSRTERVEQAVKVQEHVNEALASIACALYGKVKA